MKSSDLRKTYEGYLKTLIEEIKSEESSDTIIDYLNFCSQFHKYSPQNRMLIWIAKPDATLVAGFRAWQKKHNRTVKKGEKGIPIFAPMRVTQRQARKLDDEEIDTVDGDSEETKKTRILFRVVYVWDISQTEGDPVPELDILSVNGDASAILPLIESYISDCNIRLNYVASLGSAYGTSGGGQIAVLKSLSDEEKFRVLAHELGHELLHGKEEWLRLSKVVKETEAEATAYVVCRHFGLQTKAPTYLAEYGTTDVDIQASLERIISTSSDIVEGTEKQELQRKAA